MTFTLFETVGTGNPAHPTWSTPRDAFWATLGILHRMKGWERRRPAQSRAVRLEQSPTKGYRPRARRCRLHRLLAGPPIMLMQPKYR
jgi:hypothetical protein